MCFSQTNVQQLQMYCVPFINVESAIYECVFFSAVVVCAILELCVFHFNFAPYFHLPTYCVPFINVESAIYECVFFPVHLYCVPFTTMCVPYFNDVFSDCTVPF